MRSHPSCPRRGLRRVRVEVSPPFSFLFSFSVLCPSRRRLPAYPSKLPLPSFLRPFTSRTQKTGRTADSSSNRSDEFASCKRVHPTSQHFWISQAGFSSTESAVCWALHFIRSLQRTGVSS